MFEKTWILQTLFRRRKKQESPKTKSNLMTYRRRQEKWLRTHDTRSTFVKNCGSRQDCDLGQLLNWDQSEAKLTKKEKQSLFSFSFCQLLLQLVSKESSFFCCKEKNHLNENRIGAKKRDREWKLLAPKQKIKEAEENFFSQSPLSSVLFLFLSHSVFVMKDWTEEQPVKEGGKVYLPLFIHNNNNNSNNCFLLFDWCLSSCGHNLH